MGERHGLVGVMLFAAWMGVSTPMSWAGEDPAPKRFDGVRIVEVEVPTPGHRAQLSDLLDHSMACAPGLPRELFTLTDEQIATLAGRGLTFRVVHENLQALVDAERAGRDVPADAKLDLSWHRTYHTLAEIRARIESTRQLRPDLMRVTVLPTRSVENREIVAVEITGPGDASGRPRLAFNGCQHAREWISPATMVYFIDRLVQDYETDPAVRAFVDSTVVCIVPVVNPDGYEYTWTTNRLWRKNRRPVTGATGVDLNRNWGAFWGGQGSSGTPSNDTYRGPSAFSEPETQALRDYLSSLPNLVGHIDYHSYSQLVLWPWAGIDQPTPEPDRAWFDRTGAAYDAAVESASGLAYIAGPVFSTLYPAAGGAIDWVYQALGAASMTVELPPTNPEVGFVLPPEEIIPSASTNFEAMVAWSESLREPELVELVGGGASLVAEPGLPLLVSATVSQNPFAPTLPATPGATLWWRAGSVGPFAAVSMTSVDPFAAVPVFAASVPGQACGGQIELYIEGSRGGVFPVSGASSPLLVPVRAITTLYADSFETDRGWQVSSADTATTGRWERAVPQQTTAQPGADASDPGTQCWITGAAAGAGAGSFDIDGGTTTLVSPRLDAVAPGFDAGSVMVEYALWYSNSLGGAPGEDSLQIDISNDDGATWARLSDVPASTVGWEVRSHRIANTLSPTSAVRLRFVASDLGSGSLVEAAVDDVRLVAEGCEAACAADFADPRGSLDVFDIFGFFSVFGAGGSGADLTGEGTLNVFDVFAFFAAFGAGC